MEELLGKQLHEIDGDGLDSAPLDKPVELVADIEFAGLSLQDFADRDKAAQGQVESVLSIEECEYVWSWHSVENPRLMSYR